MREICRLPEAFRFLRSHLEICCTYAAQLPALPPNQCHVKVMRSLHRGGERGSRLAMHLRLHRGFDVFYSLAQRLSSVESEMSLPHIEPNTDPFLSKFLL